MWLLSCSPRKAGLQAGLCLRTWGWDPFTLQGRDWVVLNFRAGSDRHLWEHSLRDKPFSLWSLARQGGMVCGGGCHQGGRKHIGESHRGGGGADSPESDPNSSSFSLCNLGNILQFPEPSSVKESLCLRLRVGEGINERK